MPMKASTWRKQLDTKSISLPSFVPPEAITIIACLPFNQPTGPFLVYLNVSFALDTQSIHAFNAAVI